MPLRSSAGTRRRAEPGFRFGLLLLLLALPSRGGAAERASELRVEPARFRLWKDTTATVTFDSPTPVEQLRLTASLGTLDVPVRQSPSSFTAAWRPPAEGYPQVA